MTVSRSKSRRLGDELTAGTVNGSAPLISGVARTGAGTVLGQIMALDAAQKGKSQRRLRVAILGHGCWRSHAAECLHGGHSAALMACSKCVTCSAASSAA